jgi:isopentenyl diphosphate isomerase/L-lactate dehydrogenase-like FMN-dependent dehydrogenase
VTSHRWGCPHREELRHPRNPLGTDLAFLGRPFLFAAVARGEPSVRLAIELLSTEISRDMALLGIVT